MAKRKKTLKPYMNQSTAYLHWNGKNLLPWLITHTKIHKDNLGKEYNVETEEKRSDGHLIVMKTDCTGQRILVEQSGHPIPLGLAELLDAKVKRLKQAA
jgi:hypothetical protein